MRRQVPTLSDMGSESPLGLPEKLLEPGLTPFPLAPDENGDKFVGLFFGVFERLRQFYPIHGGK